MSSLNSQLNTTYTSLRDLSEKTDGNPTVSVKKTADNKSLPNSKTKATEPTRTWGEFFGCAMKQVATISSYFSRFSLPFSQWKIPSFWGKNKSPTSFEMTNVSKTKETKSSAPKEIGKTVKEMVEQGLELKEGVQCVLGKLKENHVKNAYLEEEKTAMESALEKLKKTMDCLNMYNPLEGIMARYQGNHLTNQNEKKAAIDKFITAYEELKSCCSSFVTKYNKYCSAPSRNYPLLDDSFLTS